MADIAKIAEDLSNLTVLEAAELATMLEEKWGVLPLLLLWLLQCLLVVTPAVQQKKRLNLM